MTKAINETQLEFEKLCQLGGGFKGGPVKHKVIELIASGGKRLNQFGYQIMNENFSTYPDANPWHVCFVVGLSWGHLAKDDIEFTGYAVSLLQDWNDSDLASACGFHLERGPMPIEQSLIGAHTLFNKVTLPPEIPDSLSKLDLAQQRWLSPVLHPTERPKYIGSWNATAMFMTALFAKPHLAKSQREPKPMLPPGGPIYRGLTILEQEGVLSRKPAGSMLDDQAFEPGALYENNHLFVELLSGLDDACLMDIHSGVYLLGTRDKSVSA